MPTTIESLNKMVREKGIVVSEKVRLKLKEEFSNTKGFLDVKQYDLAVTQKLRTVIENDTAIKPFLDKVDCLTESFLD